MSKFVSHLTQAYNTPKSVMIRNPISRNLDAFVLCLFCFLFCGYMVIRMSDISLYEKVKERLNHYNSVLCEHGVEVTLHRRSFTENVKCFNHYGPHSFFDLLEYILIKKKIEEKKYHHIPNRYAMFVLQVQPIKKRTANKKDYKKYAFLVYQFSRAKQGDEPIEWQYKEQSVITKVEKRLKKLLKRAEETASSDWCDNSLWDALRYSVSKKYEYIANYCGKSRHFWEVLWICAFVFPVLLFAIGGLICSVLH